MGWGSEVLDSSMIAWWLVYVLLNRHVKKQGLLVLDNRMVEGSNFGRESPKEHACEIISKSFRRRS